MKKLREMLNKFNLELVKLPQSTATAQEAADALSCQLGQIAKSICFWADQEPILVIASGVNRINEKLVAEKLAVSQIKIMKPDEVLETTGFKVGGVPPFGHKKEMKIIIDKDLFQFDFVWAAGGSGYSIFKLTPDQLLEISKGEKLKIN